MINAVLVKGTCFFAEVPDLNNKHIAVIISNVCKSKALIVPISSVKFCGNKEKYYDPSCILKKSVCLDKDSKIELNKKSFVRYQWAMEVDIEMLKHRSFDFKCIVAKDILTLMQDGAQKSKELEPRFQKYFDFF